MPYIACVYLTGAMYSWSYCYRPDIQHLSSLFTVYFKSTSPQNWITNMSGGGYTGNTGHVSQSVCQSVGHNSKSKECDLLTPGTVIEVYKM